MIYKRFIKQSVCEKALFYKILISPSFKRRRLENTLEIPFCFAKVLPFKRGMISNQSQNKYQNLLI